MEAALARSPLPARLRPELGWDSARARWPARRCGRVAASGPHLWSHRPQKSRRAAVLPVIAGHLSLAGTTYPWLGISKSGSTGQNSALTRDKTSQPGISCRRRRITGHARRYLRAGSGWAALARRTRAASMRSSKPAQHASTTNLESWPNSGPGTADAATSLARRRSSVQRVEGSTTPPDRAGDEQRIRPRRQTGPVTGRDFDHAARPGRRAETSTTPPGRRR
jgi:hypothetical protein